MFAHLVTAAKGLFPRSESQDALADPRDTTTNSNMGSSPKQGATETELSGERQETSGTKYGKRKAQLANNEKNDDKSKRRKRNSHGAEDSTESEPLKKSGLKGNKAHGTTVPAPRKHFRFDSEEPVVPEETQPDEAPRDVSREDEDEDSDDEAPEAIDNSAQLLKIKEQAKKQEKARQLYVLYPTT